MTHSEKIFAQPRKRFYSLVDYWHGQPIAVHWEREPAPRKRWVRVDPKQYFDLRREGFRVRLGGKETTLRNRP